MITNVGKNLWCVLKKLEFSYPDWRHRHFRTRPRTEMWKLLLTTVVFSWLPVILLGREAFIKANCHMLQNHLKKLRNDVNWTSMAKEDLTLNECYMCWKKRAYFGWHLHFTDNLVSPTTCQHGLNSFCSHPVYSSMSKSKKRLRMSTFTTKENQ